MEMKPCRFIDNYWFAANGYFRKVQDSHYSDAPGFRDRRDERTIKQTPQYRRCWTEWFEITADLGRDASSRRAFGQSAVRFTCVEYEYGEKVPFTNRRHHERPYRTIWYDFFFKSTKNLQWDQSLKIKPPKRQNPVRTDQLLAMLACLKQQTLETEHDGWSITFCRTLIFFFYPPPNL